MIPEIQRTLNICIVLVFVQDDTSVQRHYSSIMYCNTVIRRFPNIMIAISYDSSGVLSSGTSMANQAKQMKSLC